MNRAALLLVATLVPVSTAWADESAYRPTTTVAETMERIGALPEDDIWWTVPGEPMRWNNLNLAKFVPTVTVHRAGPVRPLADAPNPAIGAFRVETPAGGMSFDSFLDSAQSTTMGVLILHEGRIVYERYPRQQPQDKPLFWSVTKALVSTVLAILEDRGQVDVSKAVDHYLPRLVGSAYEGVSIRDVLDMASGVDCPDEYEDRQSCYYRYSSSIGEGFRPPGSPDNPYDYVASIDPDRRWADAGTGYSYSGVDTFVLGWLVEELTGMPFQDAFTKEVWRHIGADADALIWAGRYGIPLTSGGFMSTVRDMARFGLVFTPSRSVVSDHPLISDRYLETIVSGGRPSLLQNARGGDASREGVAHNVYQWDVVYDNGDFMKGGWAGQGLMINAEKDLVAVWTGYYDDEWGQVSVLPMLRRIWAELYPAPAD